MQKFHVTDVVEVYLIFQNNHQPLPVQTNREYRCREGKLAYGRVPLLPVSFLQEFTSRTSGETWRTLVLAICRRLGESIRATSEVEKSISMIEMLPSFDSEHFEKGSVVYIR